MGVFIWTCSIFYKETIFFSFNGDLFLGLGLLDAIIWEVDRKDLCVPTLGNLFFSFYQS